MQFTVGQKIIGRHTGRYNKEIEEFTIEKVGRKYIYVRQSNSHYTIPLFKDSLRNTENWHEIEFFLSIQDMKDHDEVLRLRYELNQKILYRGAINKLGMEKLRIINDLLEGQDDKETI